MQNKMIEEVSAAVALATLGFQPNNQLLLPKQAPPMNVNMSGIQRNQQSYQEVLKSSTSSSSPEDSKKKRNTTKAKRNFAQKLFDVMDCDRHAEIIKWIAGGKAFIVMNKRRFADEILPVYFKESQYTSFTRKLSRWKFTRVSRGPYMGAYYHKHFRRDNRMLCKLMSCNNSKNINKLNKTGGEEDKAIAATLVMEAARETRQIEQVAAPPQLVHLPEQGTPYNPPSFGTTNKQPTLEQTLILQNNIYKTSNNIQLLKNQIMEIRLRKAQVEKKKHFLMMRAEAERLREIQEIKKAVNMSIKQSENRIIDAAAKALERSNNIHQSLLQNQIRNSSNVWPSAFLLPSQNNVDMVSKSSFSRGRKEVVYQQQNKIHQQKVPSHSQKKETRTPSNPRAFAA